MALGNMGTYFPSEIARLVLGYLKEEECLQSFQIFLEESKNLKEYYALYKKGKVYSTNVNGNSLFDILDEYSVLKSEAISSGDDKIKSSRKSYLDFESEFFKTIRNDSFAETTKNAVEGIFQKYLIPAHNNRGRSSTDLTPKVNTSESSDASCNKETQKSYSTALIKHSSECRINECDNKRNANVFSTNETKKSEIINRTEVHKQYTIHHNLNRGESHVEKNITVENSDNSINSAKSSSSKLLNLHGTAKAKDKDLQSSDSVAHVKSKTNTGKCRSIIRQMNSSDSVKSKHYTRKHRQMNNSDSLTNDSSVCSRYNRDLSSTNNKSLTFGESQSTADTELTSKKDVSSIESAQLDDELQIIKEVKTDTLKSKIQINKRGSFHSNQATNDNHSSNSKPVVNMLTNNNAAINQTVDCNVQNRVTKKKVSKQEVDSSKNDPVINIQVNSIRNDGINQSAVCNIQNKVNQIDNSEHKVNSNDQVSCLVNNTPLFIQSAPVKEMPFLSFPRYILPRYESNASFVNNNNSQFYYVLNSNGTSNEPTVNGTLLTAPSFETNNITILPANPINNVLNPMSTAAVTSTVRGISLPAQNAHKTALTVSKVSSPMLSVSSATVGSKNTLKVSNVSKAKTTTHTVSINRRSQTIKSQRMLTRVSYAEFPDEIEPEEPNSSKASKRKKTPPKTSPKKKKHKATLNKKQNADEDNLSDVQRASKRKRKQRRKPHEKRKGRRGRIGLSTEQLVQNTEQRFEKEQDLCPSDFLTKTKEAKPTKIIDNIISVSTLSSSFSDEPIISETIPGNSCHSSILKDNRVLKIVLSDMFSKCSEEYNQLHNQCLDSNSNLERCNDENKDQVSDSMKQEMQNQLRNQWLDSNSNLERCNDNNKDQVSDSVKQEIQNRKSPRIKPEMNDKHSCGDSKNMDAMNVQQKKKVVKSPNLSVITDERKVDNSDGRSEANKCSSTFNMTTTVLKNCMETAVKYYSVLFDTDESNSQSSSENTATKNDEKPTAKLTFQSVIQDVCEKLKDTDTDNEENIELLTTNDSTPLSSQDTKNLSASSSEEIRENFKIAINLIHDEDDGSMVSKDGIIQCENSASVSGDSERCSNLSQNVVDLEHNKETENNRLEEREISDQYENTASVSGDSDIKKCNNLKVLEQNNDTEEVITLDISKKDLSHTINEEKRLVVDDCIVQKEQWLSTKYVSSMHGVNVNSKSGIVVARKLNFGEKQFDDKTCPNLISNSGNKNNKEDMEDSRNSSNCEILKAGSDSFNVTNATEDSSGSMCETSENDLQF